MKPSLSHKWACTHSPVFQESLDRNTVVFRDLPQKLERFMEVKLSDPLRNRYGKHDSPMTGRFKGYYHAHLRDDAILIYTLKDRAVNLIYVSTHAEIEGRRCGLTHDRISAYN
jgi:mRNA-degrading endonuclease YafQ of YafQ-DinJ toxin-antitoxin module